MGIFTIGILYLLVSLVKWAPIIGFFIDLRKNKKYGDFFGFGAIFLFLLAFYLMIPDVTSKTYFALLLTPVIFVYLFVLKFLRAKKIE